MMKKMIFMLAIAFVAMIAFPTTAIWAHCGSCGIGTEGDGGGDHPHAEKQDKAADKKDADTTKPAESEIITTESGLRYKDLKVGTGVAAEMKMKCTVHYTLWLDDGNGGKAQRIQSSKDRNHPFTCTVGYRLIQGWSEGMVGMKEGGTRQLWVPSKLGYGPQGMGGMIPPNADLIFEIEFLKKAE
jgi:FKBP-type peptidyl-prolyl cis-trans isomerase